MRVEKKYQVDYNGTNPWGQSYDNRMLFDSEEEADVFIEKLKQDENIYQAFKTVTTCFYHLH